MGIDAGWSLSKAAEFGNAAGALVVASDQGVLGAASREEVEQFIQSHRFFNWLTPH
ncbi:MAG: hypothetical protein IPK16_09625 [Anaerolineales bacterium]|nr:hypothetical protein [Anaerolineales bacterium]